MGLKLVKYLQLDDIKGALYATGGRALIIPATFIGLITKRFAEIFDEETARLLTYNLGENFGESYAETLLAILKEEQATIDNEMLIREIFTAISMESGWGKIEIKEIDLEKERLVVKITYSPSIQFIENSQYNFERGILAGAYKKITGKDIYFQITEENRQEQSAVSVSVKEIPKELLLTEKMALLPRKELEKAKAELEAEKERFSQVAESAEEWIWEVNKEGLYTYTSPIVEKILGYKPEEIVGKKHFYDFFTPDIEEDLKKGALAAFAKKEPFKNFLNPSLHKNGNIVFLETSGSPILDGEGNLLGYRGSDTDVTARREAEEELGKRAEELERMNKLMIGRELKMAELKKEIEELKKKTSQT